MVAEGTYPVEVWWSRHDLNMCREWASETCESREELIELLNFLGKCGHNIETLWGYNDRTTTNAELTRLFDVCYDRKKKSKLRLMQQWKNLNAEAAKSRYWHFADKK